MTFVTALALLAAAGAVLTSLQVFLVARLRRKNRPFARGPRKRATSASPPDAFTPAPRVSILKPLSGHEDGLEENLASFAALTGVSYEIVLSVASPEDPAAAAARSVLERFPGAPFSLIVGGAPAARISNPKIDRLIAAARHARGDVFFISDANVRVEPMDVSRTLELFDDPAVGCVSNLFVGEGALSFGAVIESLHLLTFVAPGAALADAGGVPCVVGKSMAIPRHVHDAIGGFAAFADVLAEDQAIGCAVREAGFEIVVAPVVVKNVVVTRALGKALARQVRWGKIRYSFSKATYTGELLLNPLPIALIACAAAAFLSPAALPFLAAASGSLVLLRVAQAALLARILGARMPASHLALMPVKDVLQLFAQAVPYVSKEVDWHGHRARLGPGTQLLPSRHAAATAA